MPGHSFPIFRAALRCAVLCYGTCTRSPGHNHPWHGVFRTANVDSQKCLIDQTERHFPVWNAFAWKHTSRSVRQTDVFFARPSHHRMTSSQSINCCCSSNVHFCFAPVSDSAKKTHHPPRQQELQFGWNIASPCYYRTKFRYVRNTDKSGTVPGPKRIRRVMFCRWLSGRPAVHFCRERVPIQLC